MGLEPLSSSALAPVAYTMKDVSEGSDSKIDPYLCWVRHHGCLLVALAHTEKKLVKTATLKKTLGLFRFLFNIAILHCM